jgi:glucose/arabinose dehydrogenase
MTRSEPDGLSGNVAIVTGAARGIGRAMWYGPMSLARLALRSSGGRLALRAGARALARRAVSRAVKLALVPLLALLSACGGGGGSGGNPAPVEPAPLALATSVVLTGLGEPVFATAPAGDARLFVVERAGRIVIARGSTLSATPFLDISGRVGTSGEGGLLSLAFDPLFALNGFFYVYFTEPSGDIAVERFHVSAANPDVAEAAPLRILTIPHRAFSNHKGGLVRFGPDGLLYLGTGDGGGGGDPLGNGQNLTSLLGKILRIDVRDASEARPYAIPATNPFAGQPNRRAEIWAYGVRNPWRYAFDPVANLLYIADVGQGRFEEVNVAATDSGGLNYGWNVTEGRACLAAASCDTTGLALPVLVYGHDPSGGCSVIGGFVYRGSAIPRLQGRYLYSDLCSGWLRSFVSRDGVASDPREFIANMGMVLSFGEDGQGELYVLTAAGQVLRIVAG